MLQDKLQPGVKVFDNVPSWNVFFLSIISSPDYDHRTPQKWEESNESPVWCGMQGLCSVSLSSSHSAATLCVCPEIQPVLSEHSLRQIKHVATVHAVPGEEYRVLCSDKTQTLNAFLKTKRRRKKHVLKWCTDDDDDDEAISNTGIWLVRTCRFISIIPQAGFHSARWLVRCRCALVL